MEHSSIKLPEVEEPKVAVPPSVWRLFLCFLTLGSTAFGGPAIVAYMRDLAVTRKRWLTTAVFEQGVALCQAIPGATAMQCAAYVGLQIRGFAGALAAYVGFGFPAFALMLVASVGYTRTLTHAGIRAAFVGLQLAVVAIVSNAALSFGRSTLRTVRDWLIALGSAVLLGYFKVNPILAIAAAGLAGVLLHPVAVGARGSTGAPFTLGSVLRRFALLLLAGACVVATLAAVSLALARLSLTMMKVDLLAFGGGFSSLPLMFDEFVSSGALSAQTFMDGVALGQVTPGPIVITATFFGYQMSGVLGSLAATIGIFFPSFTLVVTLAPCFERLMQNPTFRAASRGAALSFVGLLVAVTLRIAAALPWTPSRALGAMAGIVAMRLGFSVLWVLAGSVLVQVAWPALFSH